MIATLTRRAALEARRHGNLAVAAQPLPGVLRRKSDRGILLAAQALPEALRHTSGRGIPRAAAYLLVRAAEAVVPATKTRTSCNPPPDTFSTRRLTAETQVLLVDRLVGRVVALAWMVGRCVNTGEECLVRVWAVRRSHRHKRQRRCRNAQRRTEKLDQRLGEEGKKRRTPTIHRRTAPASPKDNGRINQR